MIFHLIFAGTIVAILRHLWIRRAGGLTADRIIEVSLYYLLCIQWGVGGVLADDMGLGKTVQALGVLIDRAGSNHAWILSARHVTIRRPMRLIG